MEGFGIWGNAITYWVLATIFFIVSMGYLFAPKAIAKLDKIGRKFLWSDKWTLRHRALTGAFFLAVAIVLFWAGFKFIK